jgi:hypothetical protein
MDIGAYDTIRIASQDVQKGRCFTRPTPARQDVPFPIAAAASEEAKRTISPARPELAESSSLPVGGTLSL